MAEKAGTRQRGDEAALDHIVPVAGYVAVYALLIGMTALTVSAAFVDLGVFNTPVALGIAGVKALLVMLFFMHVRWSSRLIALCIFAGFFWWMLLVAGVMSDYATRSQLGVPGR
jgi:cytochrome c oxidase subunit 4